MSTLSRRQFLKGCSAAIAALSGSQLHSAVFADESSAPNRHVLISIFLRGGADVLNMLAPIGGPDRALYEAARPNIQLPISEALPIDNTTFGLHPAAASLHELYGNGNVALIQATGMHADTRSHFEAMSFMERGTPNNKATASGWLARHLASSPIQDTTTTLPALAMGYSVPQSFATAQRVVATENTNGFGLQGYGRWEDAQRTALRSIYAGETSRVHLAGRQALDAASILELNTPDDYVPTAGADYPSNQFGRHLMTIAQLIKLDIGLRSVSVDLGGWDTHDRQGNGSGGYFGGLLQTLSDGLSAFYTDLATSAADAPINRTSVAVMSEFGRRLRENGDQGTDHGHGGMMIALGGQIKGGLFGQWPGLHSDQLYDNADLAVTTDYRQVLSELLVGPLANPNIGAIFPGFSDFSPIGITRGELLPANFTVDDSSSVSVAPVGTEGAAPTESGWTLRSTALATTAGIGLSATAGLIALRQRRLAKSSEPD